jgi:hypothetical protein
MKTDMDGGACTYNLKLKNEWDCDCGFLNIKGRRNKWMKNDDTKNMNENKCEYCDPVQSTRANDIDPWLRSLF